VRYLQSNASHKFGFRIDATSPYGVIREFLNSNFKSAEYAETQPRVVEIGRRVE
jgi:hypothetical protein